MQETGSISQMDSNNPLKNKNLRPSPLPETENAFTSEQTQPD